MESAEGLDRQRHRSNTGGRVRHVCLNEPPAELVGDRPAPGHIDVREHDVGAPLRQVPGDALTDAVAPAGDEGDLAVDVECHATDGR